MSKDVEEESLVLIDSPAGLMVGKDLGMFGDWLLTQQLCLYTDNSFMPVNIPLGEMDVEAWATEVTKLNKSVVITRTEVSVKSKHKIVTAYLDYISPTITE